MVGVVGRGELGGGGGGRERVVPRTWTDTTRTSPGPTSRALSHSLQAPDACLSVEGDSDPWAQTSIEQTRRLWPREGRRLSKDREQKEPGSRPLALRPRSFSSRLLGWGSFWARSMPHLPKRPNSSSVNPGNPGLPCSSEHTARLKSKLPAEASGRQAPPSCLLGSNSA